MADDSNQEGGGNRATVALVDSKVDTVLAEVRAGFKDVQRQLDSMSGVPERVARLDERVKDLERDAAGRRPHWPTVFFSLAAIAVSTFAALT